MYAESEADTVITCLTREQAALSYCSTRRDI